MSPRLIITICAASLGAACITAPEKPPTPPSGLSELLERPAERALVEGIRAYDDGQYVQAEAALKRALAGNLASPRDKATAYKLTAFITCTSNRMGECEAAFAAARVADPNFALSRSEAGHPLWGPVYRKGAAPKTAQSTPTAASAAK